MNPLRFIPQVPSWLRFNSDKSTDSDYEQWQVRNRLRPRTRLRVFWTGDLHAPRPMVFEEPNPKRRKDDYD